MEVELIFFITMCLFSTKDINFWGSVYTTRFAVPHLRYTKGKIVVLSSSASWLTAPRMSFYNVSNYFRKSQIKKKKNYSLIQSNEYR